MAKLLEADTLSNQDISSALEIGSYTAAAEKYLLIQVMADQVAGNDDYVVYVTRQLAGAGSAYKSMVTTEAVASGVTSILFNSIYVPASNTDVVKVYLTGAAGDTTTPDTRVEFWDAPSTMALTDVIENSVTLQAWLRRLGAFAFGKVTDAATTAPKFRDTTDSYDRISPTVDTSGNRSAVSFDDT